jgi:hypothetical protein
MVHTHDPSDAQDARTQAEALGQLFETYWQTPLLQVSSVQALPSLQVTVSNQFSSYSLIL